LRRRVACLAVYSSFSSFWKGKENEKRRLSARLAEAWESGGFHAARDDASREVREVRDGREFREGSEGR
jgi:hypothetical protein